LRQKKQVLRQQVERQKNGTVMLYELRLLNDERRNEADERKRVMRDEL
jgi:hypothetical protein